MNQTSTSQSSAADPFAKFWSDAMAQMSAAGFGAMFDGSREDSHKAMRQAFFDAWQRHCEEFMRSEAFLESMKTAMDNALAFREQMNRFVTDAMRQGPIPTKTETDSILQVLRGLEERVLDQMERMQVRMDSLEARLEAPSGTKAESPSGKSKPAHSKAKK